MATASLAIALNTPILDKGIRAVNFFNGRLLTSNDLGREQTARREGDARVGAAAGAGIVRGLEVSRLGAAADCTVTVMAGLAVSRSGQALQLASDQQVTLVAQADPAPAGVTGAFAPCGILSGSTPYVAGDGLYLLALAPTSVAEGRAPVLALDPGNVRCNTDATVEAVQLRMLRIGAEMLLARGLDSNAVGAAAISRLRNGAAHACLGFPGLAVAHGHPGVAAADDLVAAMAARGLSDCDVPLALVYFADDSIVFVDRWAVRRRVAADSAAPSWAAWLGEGIDAIAEAGLIQFQEQLADIDNAGVAALRAADSFAWLPPAGFLDAAGPRRLDWRDFLGARAPAREVPLAPGDVRAVLTAALRHDPVPAAAATRYRVYRITGAEQWLFVREAPNAPHAEEIWLDGIRAGLDGAGDVQTAIDMLRARSCRQLVLRPGIDLQAAVGSVRPGTDLALCFEPGDYELGRPLVVAGLGHVTIHGSHGAARLRIASGECALLVNQCASARVSGLSLRADRLRSGKDETGRGLFGALSIFDTIAVHVDGVTAQCAGAKRGAGAGIVVSGTKIARGPGGLRSTVHVSGCTLAIGRAQIGILCVDTDIVFIDHNIVGGASGDKDSLQRGIVVAGSFAGEVRIEDNVVGDAMEGIAVGLSREETGKSNALMAERVVVVDNSVTVRAGEASERNRFGIFVGNAESVRVAGNRDTVAGGPGGAVDLDGVRLVGVYGRQVIVRDNHFAGPRTGIAFDPREDAAHTLPRPHQEIADRVWLFQFNVCESAERAVVYADRLQNIVIDEHNIPPAAKQ